MLSLSIIIIFLLKLHISLLIYIDFIYYFMISYVQTIQSGDIMNNTLKSIYAVHTHLTSRRDIRTLQNHFLLLLFTDGDGYLQHHDNIYDFKAGDCILLYDMNELHIVPSLSRPCSFIEISFLQEHILYKSFEASALTIVDTYLNSPCNLTLRSLSEKEYTIIYNLANTCILLSKDTLIYSMFLSQQIISTIIFYLARIYDMSDIKKRQKSRTSASHTVMIEQVRQYVKLNYSAPLSLSSLADLVYTNPSYLSRIFKAETGIALSAYINEIRITHARQMLIDTDELIIDIAIACGYNYVPHFNRIFHELSGMTPTDYRKAYKKPSF